jgi:hypothetical protein
MKAILILAQAVQAAKKKIRVSISEERRRKLKIFGTRGLGSQESGVRNQEKAWKAADKPLKKQAAGTAVTLPTGRL